MENNKILGKGKKWQKLLTLRSYKLKPTIKAPCAILPHYHPQLFYPFCFRLLFSFVLGFVLFFRGELVHFYFCLTINVFLNPEKSNLFEHRLNCYHKKKRSMHTLLKSLAEVGAYFELITKATFPSILARQLNRSYRFHRQKASRRFHRQFRDATGQTVLTLFISF